MSQLVAQAPLQPWQKLQLGEALTTFYDAVGGCERIHRTPIPLSYTRCALLLAGGLGRFWC
jgi:putative membrane protein